MLKIFFENLKIYYYNFLEYLYASKEQGFDVDKYISKEQELDINIQKLVLNKL